ncbi:SUMF1/EgtB/PvdO family nonheme iron enzyme [Vibrio quintilis]|uniref:Serine/threonine-protein kinase pkn1 n=1 Tax=Vibrio quintilis TaxID=1117707 RepID=A0A1M7YPM8_9VIBR|nr:formylglycine-generating enzyme family protein [Vibrio quintilis]SHO54545.1 Serine/threonine-protein kinase pkn1 [Vibrio quintilis]
MRQGLKALLLTFSLSIALSAHAYAEEKVPSNVKENPDSVMDIDDAIFSKNTELENAEKILRDQQLKVSNQHSELDRLTKQAREIDKVLHKTKQQLENAYQQMITNPKLDITKFQTAYQNAWSNHKQNQKTRYELEKTLEEQEGLLKDQKTTAILIKKNISDLKQTRLRARAKRLKNELSLVGTQKVSFTNRCNPSMTIRQCEAQTTKLALQKAVKQFKTSLLHQTTENKTVQKNAPHAALNVHVLKHQILQTGFNNASRYKTIIEAQLEARPSNVTVCQLLDIGKQYCLFKSDNNQQKEIAWFNLNIRSNIYDDQVTIDGISYGHTPLSLTLQEGLHQISVTKDGYIPYHSSVKLSSDSSVRAVLQEERNQLKTGFRFADSLSNKVSGPELITITPGKFFIGEYASSQVILDHAFAISLTPVTVEMFKVFVKKTNYQSDAELMKTCTAMINNQMAPQSGHYWRNPGFKQSSESPVVCVSVNDAKAFTRWLSKETGFTYRLPTEDEWEIAARAGTQTDYWWGNKFESGRANTGWGGTYWSNKSTSPVKSFSPNPLGLYDVVGNVWEWTSDPQGIAKGGAWSFSPQNSTSFSRLFTSPSTAANYIGFRIVREIKEY